MGTTRIKVIDLSSDQKEIKTSRKHAEKLSGVAILKEEKKKKEKPQAAEVTEKPAVTKTTEVKPEATEEEKPQKKVTSEKPASVPKVAARHHHLGKKYHQASSLIDKNKLYPATVAIELLAKTSFTKFDPTVEIHLNVVDKNVRGRVNFPHSVGPQKSKKYLVFGDSKSKIQAEQKQIIWGDEKTIDEIAKGTLKPKRDFDQVIASPKFMPLLAKVAKILGPVGLMPNPKNGTIAEDVTSIIQKTSETGYEYKTDPTAPIIHTSLGKLSEKPQKIQENLKVLIASIGPTKIKKAVLTSTMGPGIKLDITSVGR